VLRPGSITLHRVTGRSGVGTHRSRFARRRAAVTFVVALSALSFAGASACAQFYVRSPEVAKGEAESEEHGALYSGP
jgi:hypothetical protein